MRRPHAVAILGSVALALGSLGLGTAPARAADDPLLTEAPALAPFVTQELRWEACGTAECARIQAPLDYADPSAGTLTLAATRVRSTGPQRLGTLFVNPGGPGSPAQGFATWIARVSPDIAAAYDIVAFDPRGVGDSTPIECLTGPQTTRWLLTDPTPDTRAEVRTLMARAAEIGADAVGGPVTAAIPLACAAIAVPEGSGLRGFFVRNARKEHGLQRWIEGATEPGDRVLVVEDTVTTGGSTVEAIGRVREEGFEIAGVLALVDRLAGGGEAIAEAAGAPYEALTTVDDIYPDRPDA